MGGTKFCKMIRQRVLLTPITKRVVCISTRVFGLLYKEIILPSAEIILMTET